MATELEEALTSANVTPLIQKQIDSLLLEYERRYSPLVRVLPTVHWGSTVYNFNTRTQLAPGGFVADGGARPVGTSTYTQTPVTIRLLQAVGAVTGYAQEVTADLIGNLRAREIEGTLKGLLWDIETAICCGNSASTANTGIWPQFDGLDGLVSQFTASGSTPQNAVDEGQSALTLAMLDNLIDLVESNAAMPVDNDQFMFVMSPGMNSKVAQLLTNQQRFLGNNPGIDIAPGLNVPSYRDIPIIKSSFLSTRSQAMTTVTPSTSTSGGSLTATTYYYVVTAVMARAGEIYGTEISQTTTGSTSTVTLSFSAPTGPDGAQPILYKVYRSTSTGTESLLGYVDPVVTLQSDGITPNYAVSILDTGTALIQQYTGAVQPVNVPAAYYGTNSGLKPPTQSAVSSIYLIPRDPDIVVRPYVRDIMPIDVYPTTTAPDTLPFAVVTDTALAVRAPKYVGRLNRVLSGSFAS